MAAIKPTIPFAVHDIPSSDKLVRLIVDFGNHKRRILVGMKKEREHPAEIQGMQALFVTPVLAVPEKPVPAGARAG